MPRISEEWLKLILDQALGSQVRIESLVKEENPTGFLSQVYYASVLTEESSDILELFIKSTTDDGETNEFVTGSGLDTLEMEFYKNILPTLVQFEKKLVGYSELEKTFPKFYGGECSDGDFYLILENLCQRNFKLNDCDAGLDRRRLESLVSYLHATTLAFCQTNREENSSWTWRDCIPNLSQTIENLDQLPFLKEIIPKTLKLMEERDPSFKGSKWERDLLKYSESLSSLVPKKPIYPSLIHVDLWNNNILFNDQDDLRILDLQFLSAGDPIFDLGIIILFNSNENYGAEPEKLEGLLEIYQMTYNRKLEDLGCESSKETLENVKKRFYSDGVKGGILFGLLNYDIMIIYEKLIERFSNLKRMT